MVIKDKFKLIRNTPNVLNVSENVLKQYYKEENSPRNVFTFLTQYKKNIKNHFTNKKIFDLIENVKEREKIKVVVFDDYILPVTYASQSDSIIINLKPLDKEEITDIGATNLYALLVYGYAFRQFIKKISVPDNFSGVITSYYLSLFIKVFGKEYGLLGIYASGIPKLKFMIACYILGNFFGYSVNDTLLKRASAIAPYDFRDERSALLKYDYSDVTQFIQALSEMKVLPGMKVRGFTSKIYRFLDLSFMPALEDLSRFICILLTADIKGSSIVRSFLPKYNLDAYRQIIEMSKKAFK